MNRRQVSTGLVLAGLSAAQAGRAADAPATDRFVLHSRRVGRDFLIEVSPPVGPFPGPKAPVVYALDAGYHLAAAEAAGLQARGAMAPAYIVAIGYPPGEPNTRETQLLHRSHLDGDVRIGGGGAAFEAFILAELKPVIEARYPVDPGRSMLLGHSLAGLFVANLLADRPNAFRAYLMASPSIWADPETVARVRAAAPQGRGRRVFLAVGGAETPRMKTGVADLRAALTAPGSGFVVHGQVFAGQTHRSYYPAFLDAALPDVLPGPAAR
jgi:predicted alpha/beta superfamily hydrolase